MHYRHLLLYLVIAFSLGCQPSGPFASYVATHGTEYDILIANGQILDGMQAEAYRGDVLIRADTIAYIGIVDTSLISVNRVIDAGGSYVTPGFIDSHAHGDPMQTPTFENFLAMGVTTICLGQDGGSPREADLRPWMMRVDSAQTGVNVAMFVGHGTLRYLSGVDFAPGPAAKGLQRMEELLTDALDAGCFGMTTGLEYNPGTYAGDPELLALAKIVGRYQGLIMSHMRNEDDDAIEASIRELLRQGQYCNVQASHLKVVYGKGEERAEEILALLDSARQASPFRVTADLYPYNASYTGIGIVFPRWAKPPHDYEEVRRIRQRELLDFLEQRIISRNGPEATLFGTAPYAGKTLAEVSQAQERPFAEVLLDIGPAGASGAYFVMDDTLQSRLLQDPYVMICSDGSPNMRHPRGYGSFAKILAHYVRETQQLDLSEAIRKMTSLPAQTLGLDRRGILRVGYFADIAIFDPQRVQDQASFTDPHQLATGFDWVLVNGQVAWQRGEAGSRSGRLLRRR